VRIRDLVLLIGLAASCGPQKSSVATPSPDALQPCDSARATRLALDSLGRLDGLASAVRRYEPDSDGIRIITGPAEIGRVLDGMAIVRVSPACQIVSLVQTDSA
jgi:predicted component of type VI protein secretion system